MGGSSLSLCSTFLAVTACEWDGVRAIVFCRQRVGRLAGGFGSGLVAPWLSQSCLHAWFFWLLVQEHPVAHPVARLLPIEGGWVARGRASKAAEPCKLLLAMWE